MKVKCIVKQNHVPDLVYGEVYDVISIEWDWYRIIDASGDDYIYSPKAFEVVDPYPMPPVLTKQDIKNGAGAKYRVTQHSEGVSVEDVESDKREFGYVGNRKRELAFA